MKSDTPAQSTSPRRPEGAEWDGLADWLGREVEGADSPVEIVSAERPVGGASWETFFVDYLTRSGSSAERARRVVVRRAPMTGPMAPYEVGKDATILAALETTEVPVARLLGWTEDPSIFERPFLAVEHVEGEAPDLSRVESWPRWQSGRETLGREMVRVLAAVQRWDWQGTEVPNVLGGPGDARSWIERVVRRYLEPLLADAERLGVGVPIWREIGHWLVEAAPSIEEKDLVLVHGDYRFGNLIWQGDEIVAVLDWERATIGGCMQDLGFLCMPLSRRRDPEWMGKVLRFDDLARTYEELTGRPVDVEQVQYYSVFWQFLEGVNTTRALFQERAPMILSGVLVQPNLIARQTFALIDDLESGRGWR